MARDRICLFIDPMELNEFIQSKLFPIGTTMLENVCGKGDLEMLEFLVEAKADINVRSKHGFSPLGEAIKDRDDNNNFHELMISSFGADPDLLGSIEEQDDGNF